MTEPSFDCLVIGGGPAGLTAAIYLTRFHLTAKLVDAGKSRAGWIPCTHNHAGYPDGISGKELIARMKAQAQKYGTSIVTSRVTRLDVVEGGFKAEWGEGSVIARKVLIATGVTNRRPPMDEDLHDEALARGLIRYCPICDGYEVTDKAVGVIGDGPHGVAEAVFLRGFTQDITLIAPDTALSSAPRTRPGSRNMASAPSTAPARRSPRTTTASSSTPPTAITPSTASTPRSVRTCTTSSPTRSGRSSRTATSSSTATSAPASPASTPPATSSSAWTRSATPWAKAESPR
jgi:hypothetical protein